MSDSENKELLNKTVKYYLKKSEGSFSKSLRDNLEVWGITDKTLYKKADFTEGADDAVAFIYMHHDNPEGVVYWYINSQQRSSFIPEHPPKCYWRVNRIDYTKKHEGIARPVILITSSEINALTWMQVGYDDQVNIISIPPDVYEEGRLDLSFARDPKLIDQIKQNRAAIFLDIGNNEAGRKLRDLLAGIYGKQRCYSPVYPSGYDDVSEVYVGREGGDKDSLGVEGVEAIFKSFKAYPIREIVRIGDVWDKIMDFRENGVQRGLLLGSEEMDKHLSFMPGQTWLITGVSGAGKSTWLRWYLVELMKNNYKEHLGAAMFTPEMMPPDREYRKLIELYANRPLVRNVKGKMDQMSEALMLKARNWIDKRFILTNPTKQANDMKFNKNNQSPANLDAILEYFLMLHERDGTNINVIDAWNKLEHSRGGMSETDYVSMALDKVEEYNQRYGMTTIVVAHPVKQETIEGKFNNPNFRKPTLYQVAGSANFFNKTHVGIIIDRKPYQFENKQDANQQYVWSRNNNAPTEVTFAKIKFNDIGEPGTIKQRMVWSKGEAFESLNRKTKDGQEDLSFVEDKPAESDTPDDLPF